ncbi:MAG: HEAT repeat domain-containing protein [Candidatus Heimdallarchaeota archaeon]|nr:HEAT repeat domain-containing protein [Candidatus Heimdallarchaeota archaeon]MCK4876284.1 HEAT repeat domain-containing protein [Candidatus Heimdallarchaeota archaeon]
MVKELEGRIKKFNNSPDRVKFETLVSISEQKKSKKNIEFLLKVIEVEKHEKIRIKAILTLKEFEDKKIVRKLNEFFSFERDNSVRLALIEVLGSASSEEIEEVLINAAKKDNNDIIRSIAIKHLHEREKIDQTKMKSLLMDVIQNDRATFPKQIALSIISLYAKEEDLDTLKLIFERETKFKMKQLLHQTMRNVASNLQTELDVDEPIEEKEEEPDKKKGRRRKKKVKKKKDEEYLYF